MVGAIGWGLGGQKGRNFTVLPNCHLDFGATDVVEWMELLAHFLMTGQSC